MPTPQGGVGATLAWPRRKELRTGHRIEITGSRAVKTTARWKSRKAGKRALRYISSTARVYSRVATTSLFMEATPEDLHRHLHFRSLGIFNWLINPRPRMRHTRSRREAAQSPSALPERHTEAEGYVMIELTVTVKAIDAALVPNLQT